MEKATKASKIYDEPLSKKPPPQQVAEEQVKERDKNLYSKSTLFVSTIPFEARNEELSEFFSQIGPIRSCFIIKKSGQSSGCGFVQFALSSDASKALLELKKKKFKGLRSLKLAFALKKKVVEERKEGKERERFDSSWNTARYRVEGEEAAGAPSEKSEAGTRGSRTGGWEEEQQAGSICYRTVE
jgi:RNA recognition motif-containing protein